MSNYDVFGKQRGNKLWEGRRMILLEHRDAMLEEELHNEMFVARFSLDEDKHKEMSQVRGDSIAASRVVTITLYREYGPERLSILPKGIDRVTRTLKGLSVFTKRKVAVPMDDLIDIDIDE